MMFNKNKFALIIKRISDLYSNQREFAEKSGINRTYLSKYMNMKLDNPPKPEILQRLSDSSKDTVTYEELMQICGYYYIGIPNDYKKSLISNMSKSLKELGLNDEEINYIRINFFDNDEQDEQKMSQNIDLLFSNKSPGIYSNVEKIYDIIENYYAQIIEFHENSANILKEEMIKRDMNKLCLLPVYGKISAGIPNWVEECLDGYLPIDPNLFGILNPEECFFLKVDGESMNKEIRNGAYALIRKQDIVEDGEIAAVLVNGYEATLKRFSRQGDFIILEPMSTDNSFKTQFYDKNTQIKILGKYIGKFEMNK